MFLQYYYFALWRHLFVQADLSMILIAPQTSFSHSASLDNMKKVCYNAIRHYFSKFFPFFQKKRNLFIFLAIYIAKGNSKVPETPF